jgi:hypothetical protein
MVFAVGPFERVGIEKEQDRLAAYRVFGRFMMSLSDFGSALPI